MMKRYEHAFREHIFAPVYSPTSKVLILGTIASVKSLENKFYYSHPQNLFWPILAELFASPLPKSPEEKAQLLLENDVAIWDVLASCEITGSSDASIKNPVANDIASVVNAAQIKKIFTTGKAADKYYEQLCYDKVGLQATYLPSTSPANRANYTYEELLKAYSVIKEFL